MEECCICLELVSPNTPIIQLPKCRHCIHSECFIGYINRCLKGNHDVLCPICRSNVITVKPTTSVVIYTPPEPQQRRRKVMELLLGCSTIGLFILILYASSRTIELP